MKTLSKYLFITLAAVLMITLTSCEEKEEIEYNLVGSWYTNQEIDFGVNMWGRGTVMTFNSRNQGTIGTDRDYVPFEWRWYSGYRYDTTMELCFTDEYGRRSYAYIEGAQAYSRTFSGTWYNSYEDFRDGVYGQPFSMRRD